jgi:hypothetical protein
VDSKCLKKHKPVNSIKNLRVEILEQIR